MDFDALLGDDLQEYAHPLEQGIVEELGQRLAEDDDFALQCYAALCNTDWQDDSKDAYSCSWRYAGGLIADARNQYFGDHPLKVDPEQCLNCGKPREQHQTIELDFLSTKVTKHVCSTDHDGPFFRGDCRGQESYLDFYCSGDEGRIGDEVRTAFASLGFSEKL